MGRMALQAHRTRTESAEPMAHSDWYPDNIKNGINHGFRLVSSPSPEVYSSPVYMIGLKALPRDRPV